MERLEIPTQRRSQFLDVTSLVQQVVMRSNAANGCATVFVPHTTAGITINENADPDVVTDVLAQLDLMVPWTQPFYRHNEGNSAAHVKASLVGSSVTVLIKDHRLQLGVWQAIYLAEFDGPRTRQLWIQIHSC